MKRVSFISGIILVSFLGSCDPPPNERTESSEVNEVIEPADKVLESSASNWYTYEGTVPCADCSGIKMVLRLENHPNKLTREYKLIETYLGTEDGDRKFETTGNYEVTYGMEEDPGAMLITLLDENGTGIKTFVQEKEANTVTLLDKKGKKTDSKLISKSSKK